MTGLERMYRGLLYAYPAAWRRTRGEELLGVLLLAAQGEGRRRPAMADAVNLVSTGLRTRAQAVLLPVPVLLRERVARLALVSGAALSVLCLVRGELPEPVAEMQEDWPMMPHFGPFLSVAVLLYASWLGMLAAAVGSAVAYRRARVLLAVVTAGVLASNQVARVRLSLPVAPLHVVVLLAALLALTFLGRAPLSGRGRGGLLLGTAGLAALLFAVVSAFPTPGGWWVDPAAQQYRRWAFYRGWGTGIQVLSQRAWLMVGLALVVAVLVSRWHRGWVAATAVTCVPWTWFALLFVEERNTAAIRLPLIAMAAGGLVVGVALAAFRAGARAGVRGGAPVGAAGESVGPQDGD